MVAAVVVIGKGTRGTAAVAELLWLSNDRQTQQGKLLEHRPSLSKYPMDVNDLSVLE